MDHHALLTFFLVLIGSATVVATLFNSLKLPTLVGFIVAGGLIGPYGLGFIGEIPGAEILAEIGLTLLMFTIGLEFSREKLKTLRKAFLGLGSLQVGLVTLCMAVLAGLVLPDLNWVQAAVLGFILSLSSTAIIMRYLQQAREVATPHGNGAVGMLLFQDIAFIPMVLIIPMLGAETATSEIWSTSALGLALLKIIGFVLVLYLANRFILPIAVEKVAKTRSNELFFFSILFICFGVAYLTELVGGSIPLGAFIAGLLISESPYGKLATADILPWRDSFLGIFFTSVGMLVNLQFLVAHLHWILLGTVIVWSLKAGLTFAAARLMRYPTSTSLMICLFTSQVGEFSFVLAKQAGASGLFNLETQQLLLAITVISMILSPILFPFAPKIAYKFSHPSKPGSRSPTESQLTEVYSQFSSNQSEVTYSPQTRGHTVVIGYGVAGQRLAFSLKHLKIPYKIIELNIDTVKKNKEKEPGLIFGDASKEEILHAAGVEKAKLLVVTIPGAGVARSILLQVRKLRPDLEVLVRLEYERHLAELKDQNNVDAVVAEYETTVEMLARTLKTYGADPEQVHKLVWETRKTLDASVASTVGSLEKNLDLPHWQTYSMIHPFRIGSEHSSTGKSIASLELRNRFSTSVVCVYREGLGITVPGPEFVLQKGDILHLIGPEQDMQKAINFLQNSQSTSKKASRSDA